MNPSLSDPNNHVPEVSPDDDWGDAEAISPDIPSRPLAVLPPRRAATEKAPAAAEPAETGLRIDSSVVRVEPSDDIPQRLEVQEIRGEIIRLDQDAEVTAPPKVASQFTFHERPIVAKEPVATRGESRDWGSLGGKRKSNRWVFAMGATAMLMVVGSLMALPKINATNAPRKDPVKTVVEETLPESEAQVVKLTNALLPLQPEAMRMFATYARAKSVEEVIPLLRKSASNDPELLKNWRPLDVPAGWEPPGSTTWTITPLEGKVVAKLWGELPNLSTFTAYFVSENNRLAMDWKATTCYGTATFGSLSEGSGDAREIRGELSQSQFYNTAWPEADYVSYTLVSPDGVSSVWCYARRGSVVAEKAHEIFKKGPILQDAETSRKVTVRLERGPDISAPNQWLLAEMLHTDWLSPE